MFSTKYFILSANEESDVDYFRNTINKLKNKDNKTMIEKYLSGEDYLISHSKIYRDNYQPHYLVIHRKFKENICKI